MARVGGKLPLVLVWLGLAVLVATVFAYLAWHQQRLSDRIESLTTTLAAQETHLQELATDQEDRQEAVEEGFSEQTQDTTAEAHGALGESDAQTARVTEEGDPDAFGLGLLQLALDAIARRDAARQRALVSFLQNLPDHPFRSQMLALMRDEASDPLAAKEASATLGSVGLAETLPSGGDALLPFGLVDGGQIEGWDYDLRVCKRVLERRDPYLPGEIERLLDTLRQADPRHGRIRLLPLEGPVLDSDPSLAEPGLSLLVDGRRVAEARHGTQLTRRLAFDGYDFRVRSAVGPASPWQLTLVYCPE